MRTVISFLLFICSVSRLTAQELPDQLISTTIHTVKLFPVGNQLTVPVIGLNSGEQLELHFDDFASGPRNYSYTYLLCNADWSEAQWSPFDYIKGFQQIRLNQYRVSSVAQTPYVHYQAFLPDKNAVPTRSGNYLLKVFADGDPSKVVFTKRFYVADQQASIGVSFMQPFDHQLSRTHQKLQLNVNVPNIKMIIPQQFKAVIMQNGRWDDAAQLLQPAFIRGNTMEFNAERDAVFPAGKEYRWADLQSFRFESDRVERIDRTTVPVNIFIKPDRMRSGLQYLYYRDLNGYNEIRSSEFINPWWQSDYAEVNFRYFPENGRPLEGKNLYLVGELTGNQIGDSSLMKFDPLTGYYSKKLLLKQGYYSYAYVTRDRNNKAAKSDASYTEGNYWETENDYTVFIYYRSLGGRHDELLGLTTVKYSSRKLY